MAHHRSHLCAFMESLLSMMPDVKPVSVVYQGDRRLELKVEESIRGNMNLRINIYPETISISSPNQSRDAGGTRAGNFARNRRRAAPTRQASDTSVDTRSLVLSEIDACAIVRMEGRPRSTPCASDAGEK